MHESNNENRQLDHLPLVDWRHDFKTFGLDTADMIAGIEEPRVLLQVPGKGPTPALSPGQGPGQGQIHPEFKVG